MDSNFSNNLKAARLARRFSQQQMADELGISRSAYAGYEIKRRSPSIELLQKLATVLQVSVDDLLGYGPLDTSNMITEAKVQYNVTPRAFSVEEYLNRPDCTEYELLEGKLVHRCAPGYIHQRILLKFSMEMEQYLQAHCNKCVVLPAPFCIVLDEETATVVQPDISVICRPEQIRDDICYGAPDIAVEIISPSTKDYDLFDKLMLYKRYNVGEYWIINPEEKRIILYDLETGRSPVIGSFTTAIPSFRIKGFALTIGDMGM